MLGDVDPAATRRCDDGQWSTKFDSLSTELWCDAISAKPNALYHLSKNRPNLIGIRDQADEDTSPDEEPDDGEYVDWSEHGLGLYLEPTATDPDSSPRDAKGRRLWVEAAWEWILNDAHGGQPPLPGWAERFAVTRFTLSGPRTAEWFNGYNKPRRREEWGQLRPDRAPSQWVHRAAGRTLRARPARVAPRSLV